MVKKSLDAVSKILQYNFKDAELLKSAITHRSVKSSKKNYEQLEFIGDRVIGLVIADMLLSHFPDESEGAMDKRHTGLVRSETLSLVAQKSGLVQHIIFDSGAKGVKNNVKIQADVLEACVGAVFRDTGLENTLPFIHKYFTPIMKSDAAPPKDPKSSVQEWAQKHKYDLPKYTLHNQSGSDHKPIFVIQVNVSNMPVAYGEGSTKQEASQNAAQNFMKENILND